MMRALSLAGLLLFAVLVPPRWAGARATRAVGPIPVSVQDAARCVMEPASEAPVVCDKGTNVVLVQSSLSLSVVGTLLAENETGPIGLGRSPSSWKLITVSL